MADAHKPDCESEAVDCRFTIQSENETEAIELVNANAPANGPDDSGEEIRDHSRQVV